VRYDVPRDANNNAIIGDSRNDENVIISQFHLAVLRFHNAVVDYLRGRPEFARASAKRVFQMAQRMVRWHYQWIVIHEYLPLTIGQEPVDEILRRVLVSTTGMIRDSGMLVGILRSPSSFPLPPSALVIRKSVPVIA
jgi:heme peroxidase